MTWNQTLTRKVARLQAQLAESERLAEDARVNIASLQEALRVAEADRDAARAERDTYRLDIATVCHLSEDPKIVATLTRDQLLDGLREQCVVRVDEAEDELDRARQQVKWQSIETAPKDGREVLVCDDGAVFMAAWGVDEQAWLDIAGAPGNQRVEPPPQHWMPLPAPPKKGE